VDFLNLCLKNGPQSMGGRGSDQRAVGRNLVFATDTGGLLGHKVCRLEFTNALRGDLREKAIQVLALHVGFMDTHMTKGHHMMKSDPRQVATGALDALEMDSEEVLADDQTNAIKRSLSTTQAYYLNPTGLA
jgi:hypothetical protein